MKQTPIICNTEMVKAILNSSKTVTRRFDGLETFNANPDEWEFAELLYNQKAGLQAFFKDKQNTALSKLFGGKSPYGKPGDLLWVRETWAELHVDKKDPVIVYRANENELPEGHKWKPSIHMKKEHARLWLKITGINITRLQNITEEESKCEGVESYSTTHKGKSLTCYKDYKLNVHAFLWAKDSFKSLWNSIYKLLNWDINPWVWVIEFEITNKPTEE